MTPSAREQAAIALTRFGMGARANEIETVAADPRGWLAGQIRSGGAPLPGGDLPSSAERVEAFVDYQREARAVRQERRATAEPADSMAPTAAEPTSMTGEMPAQAALEARRGSRRALVQGTAQAFLARAQLGATTPDGFAERWALFWANAFTASATKFQSAIFMGQYESEAIRPHVFGRFEDLALAAERHPAMLLYLDQAQSIGPNSQAGERRQAGLNENLAREILELHTVGADGGYGQADVTEFARALTGWSVPNARELGGGGRGRRTGPMAAPEGGFIFRAAVHEPGARTVLGQSYAEGGAEQGEAILRDLANRPETGRRLARKIATHFVADTPPDALVRQLETAWSGSGGDLSAVARALVAAPESWDLAPAKVKTPYEFVISAHRAFGTRPQRVPALQQALVQMGQPAFSAPSPEGWPDTAADWAGPDALVKRLNWAKTAGDMAGEIDAVALAEGALGDRLGDRTRQFVARAESRAEAVTLFLMSPEFQRR